jgi:predicted transcriptional regulator
MIFKEEKIENLDLSVRAINALRKCRIFKVSDLMNIDLHKVRYSGGVGRKTYAEIVNVLDKIIKPEFPHDKPEFFQSVCNVINTFLPKIKQRNREIFLRRTGLLNGKEETLESIGFSFDLTRERVRQIEKTVKLKLVKLIRRESRDILDIIIKEINNQIVLSLEDISNIYHNLIKENYKFSKNAIVNLIMEAVGKEVLFISSSGNLWTVSKKIAILYPDIIRIARRILSGLTMDLEPLAIEVSREIGFREKAEIEVIKKIFCASTRFLNIVDIQDYYSFNIISPKSQKLSNIRKDFAYFYIKGQGVPVNLREIFRAMQEEVPHLLPQEVGLSASLHMLDSNLERDKRLAWAGQSTFALVEWGYEYEVRTIDKAIERLLRRVGRPMSTEEICNHILS